MLSYDSDRKTEIIEIKFQCVSVLVLIGLCWREEVFINSQCCSFFITFHVHIALVCSEVALLLVNSRNCEKNIEIEYVGNF